MYRQTIASAYDLGVLEEYNRLSENPLRECEYQLIIDLLDEYIPIGSTVIDIGSGPGRYAEHLLQRNCKVGVVDLSAKSLKAFSDRMGKTHFSKNIIFNNVSCATQLQWIPDSSADAILLMGPLYHLINEEHRNQVLAHCKRILKHGGILFSVFLSRFSKENNSTDLNSITTTPFQGYNVPQFRCMPNEAKAILKVNHFDTLRIRNLEGICSDMPTDYWNKNWDTNEKKQLVASLRETCEMEHLLGITHQFVCVSRVWS